MDLTRRGLLTATAAGVMSSCLGGRRAEPWEPLEAGVAAMVATHDRLLWVYASDSAALEQRVLTDDQALAIRDNLRVPHHMAATSSAAYVATEAGVVRAPLVGVGGGLVAADERGAYRVALDGRHLYWLVHREGQVMRSDHRGGEITPVAQAGPWASCLTLDDGHVYWGSAEIVRRVSKGAADDQPTNPEVILRAAKPLVDLVVDRDRLWWLSTNELGSARKDGADLQILARDLEAPACLTLGRGAVYWVDGAAAGSGARIARLSTWGGPVQTVVSRCLPQAIALHGPHLYWADVVERAILRVHG